jgi:hypothetical protein
MVRVGRRVVGEYLEFLEGRCRPNTVLAAAYDLRVFFDVVAKPSEDIRATDVLGFITAQRTAARCWGCGWRTHKRGSQGGSGLVQPGLDRAYRDGQIGGHLAVGEPLQVEQQHRVALPVGQPGHGTAHIDRHLRRLDLFVG